MIDRAAEGAVASGVPTLDALLAGGLLEGDNVVWQVGPGAAAEGFYRAFLAVEPRSARYVGLGDPPPAGEGAQVAHHPLTDRILDIGTLADDVVASGVDRRRLVVTGLEHVYLRYGADAAVEFYSRTCPRLFEMGAVAYWPTSRDLLPPPVTEKIGKVAQVVVELRPDSLRVLKAEGRPSSVQGALAELRSDDLGAPVIGRELVAGRLSEGLRRLRRSRNLTQKQLARVAGVTPAAISQAEAGRRGLSLETLIPMCEQLGIGLDELLGTKREADHVLARREGRPMADGTAALFDAPHVRTRVYRVQLGGLERQSPPFAHKGVETVLVARGLVLVDLGDDTPVMRAGDGLRVAKEPIRGWANLADHPAELFWLVEAIGAPEPLDPSQEN